MVRKKSSNSGVLTPMELEIMVIIWRIEEGSVHDILDELPKERDLAYTTVSSVVRTLEKKDFVQARKRGRTHLYSPIVSRTRYAAGKLRSLVAGVFQGRPEELVRALVDESEMSAQELQEIAEIIHQEKSK